MSSLWEYRLGLCAPNPEKNLQNPPRCPIARDCCRQHFNGPHLNAPSHTLTIIGYGLGPVFCAYDHFSDKAYWKDSLA
jgi:hypothetical protein